MYDEICVRYCNTKWLSDAQREYFPDYRPSCRYLLSEITKMRVLLPLLMRALILECINMYTR